MCNTKSLFDISIYAVFWLIQKASIDIRHLVCPNDPRFIARIRVITRCLKHCQFIMPCSCHVLMCSQPKLSRVFGIHIHRLCSKSRLPAVLSVAIRCDSQLGLQRYIFLGHDLYLDTSAMIRYTTRIVVPRNNGHKLQFLLQGSLPLGYRKVLQIQNLSTPLI